MTPQLRHSVLFGVALLEKLSHLNPQPKNRVFGTEVSAYEDLERFTTHTVCLSIANFRNRLRDRVNADGGHFEHLLSPRKLSRGIM